jgi:Arc/MetJ family transcription regulator
VEIYVLPCGWYIEVMSRTVIDIDAELLAGAREILGAKTIRETVNLSLAEVVNRKRRSSLIDLLSAPDSPYADDPDAPRRDGWGQ